MYKISAESAWFQGFLQGDDRYADYFITVDPAVDVSEVIRPRTSPLLTPVETPGGTQQVWTTFSADQIDLNYQSPQLLLEIIDVLLFYVSQGAEFIRLDAIAYLWKEIGTTCIHLPQTHRLIQLFRTVLDMAAPQVMLITETNVPHQENISYFGDGRNEAQMAYQFTLAPLILHTFHTGNAQKLQRWAAGLENLPDLSGTNLRETNLIGVILSGAKYNDSTEWPKGFNPVKVGAVSMKNGGWFGRLLSKMRKGKT